MARKTKAQSAIEAFRKELDGKGYTYTTDGDATDVIYKYDVYLPSLTTLPEGVTFSNGGYVYLRSLTTLPEGVTFSNGGSVDLRSLDSEVQSYQGRTIRLRHVDDFTMLICSEKKRGDVTICRAKYFGGGDIDQLRECYVASEGENHAHGETVEKALQDLRFKVAAADFDPEDTVAEIVRTGFVERHQFRLLTGACEDGLRAGLEQAGLPGDSEKLPLDVALKAAHGSYGTRFKELVRRAA